jgi:hypothetical protein
LAFFYFIGYREDDTSCVAVAATAPQNLVSGDWDFPATCVSDSRGDQCAILHIDATNTFYSACAFGSDGPHIRIQAFDNCEGAPGPAYGCYRTALVDVPGVDHLQFSIAENPCTGHLSLVYRKGDEIRLRFYDEQLHELSDTRIRNKQSFANGETNDGCTNGTIRRCGQGTTDCVSNFAPGQCLRVNGRPSIDTYEYLVGTTRTCGAVLAYDSLAIAEDGNLWAKSRLDIVDITTETGIAVQSQWLSTDDRFAWNQYLSYATVSHASQTQGPDISWFWLTDIRGACKVIAEGATSRDLGETMQATGIISGPFPAIHYRDFFGIGDYFAGAKGGDFERSLLVTWGEPVLSSDSTTDCVLCMGKNWNLATKVSRIHWLTSALPPARARESASSTRPLKIH